ncbi:bifunctional riboflavin kinase/FAD synthetase [Serpentinicella alkaliphila]|uniref:Riboflavin biosynthesis protein n=1 Tax=Serpentinicella alkaliphila TaxID=1734049 RepID=A0A4R2TSX9_9FIRM|nr:bifunctional riboflavin kinase/FAD synthetase [Serpentinicella alkaliphila]QUH26330.1 bifunctional riboflavin kinase/FAD synthetase [Serpentinicella alkaliphila]TCQ05912.1 FMN adenylyltransferase /riboflavin kinase [Serpentinicella alkaliphila]
MIVVNKYEDLNNQINRGVALGNFDGIHIGHQSLITTLLHECAENNLESCVYTFLNHPLSIITKTNASPMQITNLHMKERIFEFHGLDILFLDEFNEAFMNQSPEEFVVEILVKKLKCKVVVVGFDYRFGSKGLGDTELLKELGKEYSFKVIVVEPVEIDGIKVSSTKIRALIVNGEIEQANEFLGRPFTLAGQVVHGEGRGRKLGFPTANISINPGQLIPQLGVYATEVVFEGKRYIGATSISSKPTFGNQDITVETFILDFSEIAYDKNIEIIFTKKVRNQTKFNNEQELIDQIQKDITVIKNIYKHN